MLLQYSNNRYMKVCQGKENSLTSALFTLLSTYISIYLRPLNLTPSKISKLNKCILIIDYSMRYERILYSAAHVIRVIMNRYI